MTEEPKVPAGRPIQAVAVGGRRFYRPSDASRVLGWTDPRRVKRNFRPVQDKRIVESVIRNAAPTPGRRPTWVVDADEVDAVASQVGAAADPESVLGSRLAAERDEIDGDYESRSARRQGSSFSELDRLRDRVVELEGAYGAALEHREQLLEQVERLHRLGLAEVAAQRTLLDEMRNFSVGRIEDR